VDETIEARRAELVRQMEIELAALQRWRRRSKPGSPDASDGAGFVVRLVELHDQIVELDPLAFEQVPPYGFGCRTRKSSVLCRPD